MPVTYTSSSSTSYSSSSSGGQSQTSGSQQSYSTHTDADGRTTVTSTSQDLGGPAFSETRTFDADGRPLIGGGNASAGRIEDVSQEDADKLYEERMEDEYAKREGGA